MIKNESDYGTPETQAQGGGITKGYTEENERVAHINSQNHFDTLYARGHIDDKQWQAGEYLRRDAYMAGQFAYVRSSADFSVRGNVPDEPAEFIYRAKEKFKDAMAQLDAGQTLAIEIIVLDDGYIPGGWRRVKRGIQHLRAGLDVLVKVYGV